MSKSDEEKYREAERLADIATEVNDLLFKHNLALEDYLCVVGSVATGVIASTKSTARERRLVWFHFIRQGNALLEQCFERERQGRLAIPQPN